MAVQTEAQVASGMRTKHQALEQESFILSTLQKNRLLTLNATDGLFRGRWSARWSVARCSVLERRFYDGHGCKVDAFTPTQATLLRLGQDVSQYLFLFGGIQHAAS